MMTREQLESLMTWAKAMVRYEDEHPPAIADMQAELGARQKLYESFGFDVQQSDYGYSDT